MFHCGVLLTSEKTYGRAACGLKMLYKCVPDDATLPPLLIPYEEKQIGFHKVKYDHYITFQIKHGTSTASTASIASTASTGIMTNNFGDTNDTEAYIAYRMACADLNPTMKTLNAATLRTLRETTLSPLPLYCNGVAIADRRSWPIISIDPAGCNDIDDALGLKVLSPEESILSIYISNVPMMLEYLNLWPFLTDRITTVYLPDKKIPMLPFALSENVCSLYQKEDRTAFVLDITLHQTCIKKISFTSALVRVEKNYAYDAAELLGRDDYKGMLNIVRKLNNESAVRYLPTIQNSHDLVEYCMLFMNRECAKSLQAQKTGIFRSATRKTAITDYTHFEPELQELLQNVAGEYCLYENLKPHELIGCESYLHITSPIRRLVDIVNMLEIQAALIPWSPAAQTFMGKWKTAASLAQINRKTKAARKLQNEIEVLEAYQKNPERIYMGVVFNKTTLDASLYKYSVYIPETKVLTTVKGPNVVGPNVVGPNVVGTGTATVYLSAHLFLDEAKMTKKIRLQFL